MKKPKRMLDALGPDVEITNRRIHRDAEMKLRLKGLGKLAQRMIPDAGTEHAATLVTHIFINEFTRETFFLHDHTFPKAVSEAVVSSAIADKSVHLMEVVFGRKKPATRDPKDLRGKKDNL